MGAIRKILVIAGIALGIIVAGVVIGMLATGGREVTFTKSTSNATGTTASTVAPPSAPLAPVAPVRPQEAAPVALPSAEPVVLASTNAVAITNWSEQLDEILGAEKPETEKANQLLQMFPRLPKDGQEEVAQHLTNLVDDQDYAALGRYLTNSTLSEDVLDILFSDLFNRPNPLKLPLLVDLASDAKHPKASEAKDLLELYLEEDYGTDWARWRAEAEKWIKDNPE